MASGDIRVRDQRVDFRHRTDEGGRDHAELASRALDETPAINNSQGTNDFIMDPHHPALDYGPACFDQTHRFAAIASYEVPLSRGERFSAGPPTGSWETGWSESTDFPSGIPYSMYAFLYFTGDQTGSGFVGRNRANVAGSPFSGFSQTATEWFNTSAFASPEPGTYGDEGKGLLRGLHFADLDMSFAKNFPITERQRLQARLDMFNVGSNGHSKLLTPDHRLTDSNFGSLASNNGVPASLQLWTPRTIQLRLLYSFWACLNASLHAPSLARPAPAPR